MATKQTFTYDDYLASLPAERKDTVEQVWQMVRTSMPGDYTEQISPKYLMFAADGEMYVSLANQKNYISLHLMPIYVFPEQKAKLEGAGKKLKGGKSCINFLRVEELPLDVIAEVIGSCEAEEYKEQMQELRSGAKAKK